MLYPSKRTFPWLHGALELHSNPEPDNSGSEARTSRSSSCQAKCGLYAEVRAAISVPCYVATSLSWWVIRLYTVHIGYRLCRGDRRSDFWVGVLLKPAGIKVQQPYSCRTPTLQKYRHLPAGVGFGGDFKNESADDRKSGGRVGLTARAKKNA